MTVDTGLPAGTPEEVPDENSMAFTGKDICSYMEAFVALGYKPEQVTKILLTHKHADYSGEIRSFPNARIYVGAEEISAAELQGVSNLVPVEYTDGAYYNFPDSQKISEGVYFIKAKGHTNGNSIVIIENWLQSWVHISLFVREAGSAVFIPPDLHQHGMTVGVVKRISLDLGFGSGMIHHDIFAIFVCCKTVVTRTIDSPGSV